MKTIITHTYEAGDILGTVREVLDMRTITAEYPIYGVQRIDTRCALCGTLGRILDTDMDKRVQLKSQGILGVESDGQRDERLARNTQ